MNNAARKANDLVHRFGRDENREFIASQTGKEFVASNLCADFTGDPNQYCISGQIILLVNTPDFTVGSGALYRNLKKSAMRFPVFAASFIFIWNAHCAELDSVTPRGIEFEEGINELNRILNKRLQEGVDRANYKQLNDIEGTESHEFCDEEILFDSIRGAVFQTRLTGVGSLKGYALDKQLRVLLEEFSYALPLELSIMKD